MKALFAVYDISVEEPIIENRPKGCDSLCNLLVQGNMHEYRTQDRIARDVQTATSVQCICTVAFARLLVKQGTATQLTPKPVCAILPQPEDRGQPSSEVRLKSGEGLRCERREVYLGVDMANSFVVESEWAC